MVSELIVGCTTTTLGALLPRFFDEFSARRRVKRMPDLTGMWLSFSHSGDYACVRDHVQVTVSRGKLRFANIDKPYGYYYQANCRVKEGDIIVGDWHSLSGSAQGQVLLRIDPQSSSMYGFYSGVELDGQPLFLGWVLVRDERKVEEGLSRLQQCTKLVSASSEAQNRK
jgi:hypothetical protein